MKVLILGAGPAGLTVANQLLQNGLSSFLVLEKENMAGGLCRSVQVDGAPFDIGGGHFLDVRNAEVNKFLFEFMPKDEWNIYERNSKILINDNIINSPFEANIWQMDIQNQVKYLKDIAIAGCNLNEPMPHTFVDWIYWKLGKQIALDYMIPYNKKMFADDLDELGTYWLEKLPNVSFEETLLSCLNRKFYGEQPAHAKFYYPKKFGYGEMWLRMANKIKNKIIYNESVTEINFDQIDVKTESGKNYQADVIVNTIPWMEFDKLISMPKEMKKNIEKLKYSSIETSYFSENINTDAQWIYYPNLELAYHRILVRSNFCTGSKGYWTETRKERVDILETGKYQYLNQYAYPLNTINKPEIMKKMLDWCKKKNVYTLGRWGEHQHYNSDVVVEKGIELANRLLFLEKKNAK